MLFELLAGYNPFEGESPTETYKNIRNSEINWPPYINRMGKEFIKKLLIVEPSERLPFKRFYADPLFLVLIFFLRISQVK